MLKKLIKEEWKNTCKVPLLFIAILLIASVIAGLTFALPIWDSEWIGLPASAIMLIMLYYFAMIISSVGIMIYLAVRFYRSMYTDEGYLTHTLPATARQTLLSKVITMSLWELISIASIFVSLLIFGGMIILFLVPSSEMSEFWYELSKISQEGLFRGWQGFMISIIAMMIFGCFSSTMMVTGSISIGQMVRKHRILGAIGAYFAIHTIIQIISAICLIPQYTVLFESQVEIMEDVSIFDVYTPIYLIMTVVMLIAGIVMYFISEHIASKKLELE